MTLFQKNLNIIKNSSDLLYDSIVNENDQLEVMTSSENARMLIKYKEYKCFLHSIDIEFEMHNMFKKVFDSDHTIIVFGVGNGYFFEYIKRNYPNIKKVVLVEPSMTLFKQYLNSSDLKTNIQNLSVSFCINKTPEFMGVELGKYISDSDTKLICHPTYLNIFRKYYANMLEATRDVLNLREGNYNFQRNVNKLVMMNSLANMKYGYRDIRKLKELISGKPLIVVGAGPSLKKNMHLLKKIYDEKRAIIIAVGTAIKVLDQNDIIPHFRMAFDAMPEEKRVVEGIDTKAVPIIYSNALYYEILNQYQGEKIGLDVSSNYLSKYLCEVLSKKHYPVGTGSSILISAISMGINYKCSKVIILGADLSTQGKRRYAHGAGNERELSGKKNGKEYECTDIFDNKVFVEKGYYLIKVELEQLINGKDIQVIDATEGGVKKEGTTIKTLQETIQDDLSISYDLELYDEILVYSEIKEKAYVEKLEEIVEGLTEELLELQTALQDRLKRLKILNKNISKALRLDSAIIELQEFDVFFTNLSEYKSYEYLIKPSTNNIIDAIVRRNSINHIAQKKSMAEVLLKKNLAIIAELIGFIEIIIDGCKLWQNNQLVNSLNKTFSKNKQLND